MNQSFDPVPITLEGRVVRLEPLELRHAADLFDAGRDESVWRYMPYLPMQTPADSAAWIAQSLDAANGGAQVPFAIIFRESGKAIGSTRYLDISRADRRLEIGATWISPQFQRTAVNTECKYLLLRHAFETLNAVRVQLKTDARNEISQRAILRLGAVKEGVLRRHMVLPDGFIRDTVYFSILGDEWPAIKARLEGKLQSAGPV